MKTPGRIVISIAAVILLLFTVSIAIRFTREDPKKVFLRNSNLRVEVLNGCGVNRLALKVTDLLREQGFNVVSIGATRSDSFPESVVLERADDGMENARYFAKRIGCKNVGKDVDPALYFDITLIIGRDYQKIFPNVEKKF
jgi:hypothetical protein